MSILSKFLGKFLGKGDVDKIPEPGTPPTRDKHGVITDPGNPWIGPINPKVGYPTEGYSGAQLRIIRRAAGRRQAAEIRVNSRQYAKLEKQRARYESFVNQRTRIVMDEVVVTQAMSETMNRDQQRRLATSKAFETQAAREQAKADRREDRLDERRIARFKAGKPRGKDLREETFKEYSSFLPRGYFLKQPREGQFFIAPKAV